MAELSGFEKNYLSDLLLRDFKKQTHTIEGSPEFPRKIADKLALYAAVSAMDDYKQSVEDDKSDYSSADGGEV